jgi:hypothetical protein
MASNDIRAYQELTGGWLPQVKAEGHPLVLLFHLLFKVLPLTAYLLYEALQPLLSEIFLNELIIALVVFDFWLTKNICGRLLVGLRWWLDEDEREVERLKVECKMNDEEQNKSVTATLFWGVQIAYLVTALVLLIINVFRMNFRNVSGLITVDRALWSYGDRRRYQPVLLCEVQQRYNTYSIRSADG